MKKVSIIAVCIALFLTVCYATSGNLHLPGHGNVEISNYGNDYYKENGDVRFSTNVVYNVIARDGSKEKRTAHIICNEDRDKIYEWKDI